VPACTACLRGDCQNHVVHEDLRSALRNYRTDSASFQKVFEHRDELIAAGVITWCAEFDAFYRRRAQKLTREYEREHPDDPYPRR